MASFGLNANTDSVGTLDLPATVAHLSPEEELIDLFNEMRLQLLRHLMWLNLSADQAEDIVQETFLRLHQHLSREEFQRSNLRGWVWRVAHNLGLNLRMAANKQENGREVALNEVAEWLADPGSNPEQLLQQQQSDSLIAKGVLLLDDRDKQCFHLRVQGMGYRQIASVMGIGRSTVADALDRVTKELRKSYSHP